MRAPLFLYSILVLFFSVNGSAQPSWEGAWVWSKADQTGALMDGSIVVEKCSDACTVRMKLTPADPAKTCLYSGSLTSVSDTQAKIALKGEGEKVCEIDVKKTDVGSLELGDSGSCSAGCTVSFSNTFFADAGFNCAFASSKAERIICANPELAKLDKETNRTFQVFLEQLGSEKKKKKMKKAQRAWAKGLDRLVDKASNPLDILKSAYEKRLQAIR